MFFIQHLATDFAYHTQDVTDENPEGSTNEI